MATITSVVPTSGFFAPSTSYTVNGTGFGASPGTIILVLPFFGFVAVQGQDSWADTNITVTLPTLKDIQTAVPGLFANGASTQFFVTVIPLGSTQAVRSEDFTLQLDPTPITIFQTGSLVVGGADLNLRGTCRDHRTGTFSSKLGGSSWEHFRI